MKPAERDGFEVDGPDVVGDLLEPMYSPPSK
jgi:hypothetical protein